MIFLLSQIHVIIEFRTPITRTLSFFTKKFTSMEVAQNNFFYKISYFFKTRQVYNRNNTIFFPPTYNPSLLLTNPLLQLNSLLVLKRTKIQFFELYTTFVKKNTLVINEKKVKCKFYCILIDNRPRQLNSPSCSRPTTSLLPTITIQFTCILQFLQKN